MLPFSELIRKYFNFYKIFQSNLTWYSQSLLYWWKYFCRWSPEAVYVSSRILSFHRKPEIFFYQILFSLLKSRHVWQRTDADPKPIYIRSPRLLKLETDWQSPDPREWRVYWSVIEKDISLFYWEETVIYNCAGKSII